MMFTGILDTLEAKEQIFRDIVSRTTGLTAEQAGFRPSAGRWSVAEVLEHLTLVEPQMVLLIRRLIEKTKAAPGGRTRMTDVHFGTIHERMKAGRFEAHPDHRPDKGIAPDESLTVLRKAHSDLLSLGPQLQEVNTSLLSFPHRFLGPLTLGQWVAFCVSHEARHTAQIHSIMRTSTFPQTTHGAGS